MNLQLTHTRAQIAIVGHLYLQGAVASRKGLGVRWQMILTLSFSSVDVYTGSHLPPLISLTEDTLPGQRLLTQLTVAR